MTKNRSRPPEYTIWHHAKRRCFVPSTPHFEDYGGRGITMCERWQKSFEAFYVDMGPRPTPKHSLERENTNGNYEPGNCRWATRIEQANNTRRNRHLTAFGRTLTASQWARELNLDPRLIYRRVQDGWSPEEALTRPRGARIP